MTDQRRTYSLPLAQGELSEKDALELQQLKEQIRRDVGFFCDGYKEHCLRRRIAVRMRARGMHTYAEYADLLLAGAATAMAPHCGPAFVDFLPGYLAAVLTREWGQPELEKPREQQHQIARWYVDYVPNRFHCRSSSTTSQRRLTQLCSL